MADGSECNMPEFEQMRSLKLFSDEEISVIKKVRDNFEYKVSQPSSVIKDYVKYIKYERDLMATTKERIKQRKVTTAHTILVQIADGMKKLYANALSKFPKNTRYWDEYIKFLKTFKYTKDISPTFDRMLQFHSDKPEVWIRAILWEYKENFNDERVKKLLLGAQQLHPESQKLYLTFFQIELENKRQLEALAKANVVYSSSKKKFTDIEFYIEMLNIADKFKYAGSIKQTILEDMRMMFPREEILWHTLAQRELNGLSGSPQHTLKKRIELSIQIYKKAVKLIDTNKMWNYYIDAMVQLNSDLSTQSSMKQSALQKAFEGANESNHMSEDHYLQYIELLWTNNPKDENIERVFKKATKTYESSLKIWTLCMRYYIQQNNYKKLQEVFEIARHRLGPKGAPVWELYLIYLKTCLSAEARADFDRYIFELARQPHATFNELKASILELLGNTVYMRQARKIYALFIKHCPGCYEVHEMMADMESKQMVRDTDSERACMQNFIDNFGHTRTDVWLRYMRFERSAGDPKNVNKLHKSALAKLKPELLDNFSEQYNFFLSGVV